MTKEELEEKARNCRLNILRTVKSAGKGHIGGAFSCIDIIVSLFYDDILRVSSFSPNDPNRDRFILSKGHSGTALYVVLADLGFFDAKELDRFNQGGILGEHPDARIPGVEINTGSLGHGLSVGCGMAMFAKLDSKDFHTFVLLGDGECQEGSVWEAAMFASHHKLDNLTAIIDRNRLIIHGNTEKINALEPLNQKWKAFGWDARVVDGHSFSDLRNGFADCRLCQTGKPLVIIANTHKGKGVSFMEDQASWHHGGIDDEHYKLAYDEIKNG